MAMATIQQQSFYPNSQIPLSDGVPVAGSTAGRDSRVTLGLLTHGAGDPCGHMVWAGVAAAAAEHDVNLICFPAKPLRSPLGFEALANVLYDLVSPSRLDALVIWLAGMTIFVNTEEARHVCERYRPLPMVTAGGLIEGLPGVVVDNYHGMWNVVAHLIEVHGHRRIAFVRGPANHQEAEERYTAYVDALAAHGLAFDPQLVVQGNFKENGGLTAVEVLLDRRQAQFDALVAASDNMAVGAMKALQARGIRVPADVGLAGLNDEAPSAFITPPLTTGPLHFFEQGQRAAEMALALLRGEEVPERVVLPTRLLVRQSCGCPDPLVAEAAGATLPAGKAGKVAGRAEEPLPDGGAAQLLDAFRLELTASAAPGREAGPAGTESGAASGVAPGPFLAALAEFLRRSAEKGENLSNWHSVISALRLRMQPCLAEPARTAAENLWQQARVTVGETVQRVQAYRRLQAEEQSWRLAEVTQALSTAITVPELADLLAGALPSLGIAGSYLALYEQPEEPANVARLVGAYGEHGRLSLEAGGLPFDARRLVPEGLLPAGHRFSLVVEPLYFRQDQLGFVLFEADPGQEELYEILRGQISAAIKRAQLDARNVELYREADQARAAADLARQKAEDGQRLAEQANLLKSRFLATVSHELRTPLSLIVGTIEMMLREETPGPAALPESYRRDLSSVRGGAQHLAHLIGDVLDLASSQAGELRLTCETLRLDEVLEDVALLAAPMAREKGLRWRAVIPGCLPPVWGDRTRLQQVVLNLASNAIKFTERGEVVLQVEPGPNGVTVAVTDTGVGIPAGEREAIFDEFRQSERTARRGYGGMGLGLAISRRLIELHGGRMGVESSGAEGAGSTFYFTLPVLAEPEPGAGRNDERSGMVLLLTERMGGGAALRTHLAQRGFAVAELAVSERVDWLAQVVSAPPGAVVLDFEPAAERGWEVMRLLKVSPGTQDIPVLFYSLSAGLEDGALLALDYLTKPVGSDDLARALERQGLLPAGQARQSILLVDDDQSILDLHARVVQLHLPECRIRKAHDGREALRAMEQECPDLVLLDLMMPEMDGFAVLQAMRERPSTRSVPVIVLTAQILTREDMARLQQGVTAVLGKGLFTTAEVLAQVETALGRSKRLGSEAQRVVRQAMAYIHEHYAEPISREELAARFCLNERYLTRCFRQESGVTPIAYLNRYRIRQARVLLESGETSVTEVALATGFSDSSYFGRVFQKEMGLSPAAYRRARNPPLS
jgi:signal transduction histidine kinase/DNA-binding LacI/PurR family transcriptional regulator/AraC-like DNA-binding protein